MGEAEMKGFEVLGKLKGRVDLIEVVSVQLEGCIPAASVRTSESSTKGGPSFMSAAFVPGRILLESLLYVCAWPRKPSDSREGASGD